MQPAVEFESSNDELHLLYSPRDDDQSVHDKFDRGEPLVIKGTFRLTRAHLVPADDEGDADEEFGDDYPLRFRIAKCRGDYFKFDPRCRPSLRSPGLISTPLSGT